MITPLPAMIAEIKKNPGKYILSMHLGIVQLEVDEKGDVWQLTPEGVRDGVLRDDGWNLNCSYIITRIQ